MVAFPHDHMRGVDCHDVCVMRAHIYHLFFIYAGSNYLWRQQSYHLLMDVDVACNNANAAAIIFEILGHYLAQLSTLELVETT